jgi:hypothetical protein
VSLLQTGKFFDALCTCPWYTWNAKNKSTLLIFMANSLKPLSFSFAGVVLDYKLAVTVKYSYSNCQNCYFLF